jgi:hypothetical protein
LPGDLERALPLPECGRRAALPLPLTARTELPDLNDNAWLKDLEALVLKSGVSIGGLTAERRALALGVLSCALAPGICHAERDVNAALRQALAGFGAFLDTDHVELRRWLVDSGWWVRDGYGRAYERVPVDRLPEALQGIARGLVGVDVPALVARLREQHVAAREARRSAFRRAGSGMGGGADG